MLTTDEWHQRFCQQAQWTASVRKYLIGKFALQNCTRCLEAGCGTGAILEEIKHLTASSRFGIDIARNAISYAQSVDPKTYLGVASADKLPFSDHAFDFSFCHFLLLWVSDPVQVLTEMKRVTRPGGWVFAFAEPDYGGRLDYPVELDVVGKIQKESLTLQGANPEIGRSLGALFHQAGLKESRVSILGGEWGHPIPESQRTLEWRTFLADWELYSKKAIKSTNPIDIKRLEKIDRQSSQTGERLTFVPTFFAWGQVP